MLDGTLLRGEVLARWQEFVGTGEFFRQVESTVSRVRDRFTSFLKGEPARADHLGEALQSGVESLVVNRAELAASAIARAWRTLPGGDQLLTADPALARSGTDVDTRIQRLVRDWQGDILQMVRDEGRDRRTTARIMAYGVNGLGVVLMLVTFASTAGITGAEVGIAGGTAVVGQKLLEAVFGDQAVRELARQAREQLTARVDELYAAELARYEGAVTTLQVDTDQTEHLTAAAAAVEARAMSPIRMGRARVATVSAAELGTRTTELSMALVSGADELDPSGVEVARRVVDKAVERSGIAGDHTVVALAGATGSGKSSLFNALVGADVATIGARRPTTSRPTAGLWGDADASELLDWLGVAARHVVDTAPGAGDGPSTTRAPSRSSVPSTDSCSSTCRTSTPASSSTDGRPSACSSSSTSSSG